MKKVLLGGFLFLGGAVLLAAGALGIAHVEVQAGLMVWPKYLGIAFMAAGVLLGVLGLREKE